MNLKKILLIAFIFSGSAALIYELTWIRPIQFLLGSTTYTISIIFAAFMAGLMLGSLIISRFVNKIKNLPLAYAIFELGIGIYGVLLLSLFNILPRIYNLIYPLRNNFYIFEIVQFFLVFLILLIPTTLMGATFPVIMKIYAKDKIGKSFGEIYSANNLGAIIGSFSAGFILIPLFGIKGSVIIAGVINLLIAFAVIFSTNRKISVKIIPASLILFILLAVFGNYNIQQMHSGGFYRTAEVNEELGPVIYYAEGIYSTVTVRDLFGKGKSLFINGKGQGGTEISDLRVNFLLSYLPLLINPNPEKALVIGLGTGTTSGQIAQFAETTTVEIESKVAEASEYFGISNADVLENPNHQLLIDDGRNYLIKNTEKYNLIIQEPSDPWQSFSANLYSREFFELVSEDLTEDGLYVKWVPIYTMSSEDFRNLYNTFNSVFPNVVGFANIMSDEDTPAKFETSEILLIGSKTEINLDKNQIKERYDNLPPQAKEYLNAIKLSSGEEIYHLLLFTDEEMKGYSQDARIVTDDNSLLEFSTAKNVLNQNSKEVISDIEQFISR